MSTYFSRLLQTVEGDRPFDPRQVAADAKTVEALSHLPWEGFAHGTERGDTRAKEDIWLEEERFKKRQKELQGQAADLSRAAESGHLARLNAEFLLTREICNGCHQDFRHR